MFGTVLLARAEGPHAFISCAHCTMHSTTVLVWQFAALSVQTCSVGVS